MIKNYEIKEGKYILENDNYNHLYPSLNDINFNLKITEKKEFNDTKMNININDVEEEANKLIDAPFELSPHQMFIKNYLSFNTPYNSMLLFHGLGTGKTCSSIGVAEEMRKYMEYVGIKNRIIIVASPNVQENYRNQLFDERKLELVNDNWKYNGCVGNDILKDINPMNLKLTKEKIITLVNKLINNNYLFIGYTKFANYIQSKSSLDDSITGNERKNIIKRKLNKVFKNRLIIIDEVHNLRITDDNNDKKVGLELFKLVENVKKIKLLLLSATPLYNSYKEIIWLLNLMNINDNRTPISNKDIFDNNGNFRVDNSGNEIGKELLIRKSTGYISFVKGENPYIFPYRIFPSYYDKTKSVFNIDYPRRMINNTLIETPIKIIDLYIISLYKYQEFIYNNLINQIFNSKEGKYTERSFNDEDYENNDTKNLGYNQLLAPLQSLNIVYPSKNINETNVKNYDLKDLLGKKGLQSTMKYEENWNEKFIGNFKYKTNIIKEYGKFFDLNLLKNYSSKIYNICNNVMNSSGVILIYSDFIDSGLLPMALALESMGFSKYNNKSLFKEKQSESLDALTMKKQNEISKDKFKQAKYIMITGNELYSPNNDKEIKVLTNSDNKYGEKIKVVLISRAGSEGLDFKFIRQIHIMEPWYNLNRIEQIIGRGIRNLSHKDLPFKERNAQIFLYGSLLNKNNCECVDLYLYRKAEDKSIKMGKITRLLKENSVDCMLNYSQTNFNSNNMNQTVIQLLSNGNEILYDIGDKSYSSNCDYMKSCEYKCINKDKNNDNIKVNFDTYNHNYILLNSDKIINRIKDIFKDKYVLKINQLIKEINILRNYPLIQIYSALTYIINNNVILYDKYNRKGNLINIDNLYFFKPVELSGINQSIYNLENPIEYKRDNIQLSISKLKDRFDNIDKLITVNESEKKINKIIENINNNIKNSNTKAINIRGIENWYVLVSNIKEILINMNYKIEDIDYSIIKHNIDMLQFNEHILLLNHLFFTNNLTQLEKKIKNIYEEKIITSDKINAILISKNKKNNLLIKNTDKWVLGEYEDYNKFNPIIKKNIESIDNINRIVGFITEFKNEFLIFKIKDLEDKRSKGFRCDQASKSIIMNYLNIILKNNKLSIKDIGNLIHLELCVLFELILRLNDNNKTHNKRWFFDYTDSILVDIEKIFH